MTQDTRNLMTKGNMKIKNHLHNMSSLSVDTKTSCSSDGKWEVNSIQSPHSEDMERNQVENEIEDDLYYKDTSSANYLYGTDTIPVVFPSRISEENNSSSSNYNSTTIILSPREYNLLLQYIPDYQDYDPHEILDKLEQWIVEDQDQEDSNLESCTYLQNRILTLEDELRRMETKLTAARSLHSSMSDENTSLRAQLRASERRCVQVEKLAMQNEILQEQAVASLDKLERCKVQADAHQNIIISLQMEIESLRSAVLEERQVVMETTQVAFAGLLQNVKLRERSWYQKYEEEKKELQLMTEKYYEATGKIRVVCRLRPQQEGKISRTLVRPKSNTIFLSNMKKEFSFDHIFGPDSTQKQVYEQLEPMVQSFADGYNACIMAYGQTGSGKTYTMLGAQNSSVEGTVHDQAQAKLSEGMIPRALQQIFELIETRQSTYSDTVSLQMLEIYNDQLIDLLESGSSILKSENDLCSRKVSHWKDVQALLNEGNANRNIASTKMNVESSRSHALVFLHMKSQNMDTLETKTSTLCLVDLAGSERLSRSKVEGERLKETQHINKSLAALGDVVYALQHKNKHIPYRNSKLTYMLRDMLSSRAKTVIMLQLSPDDDDIDETFCSLQFGARVSQIQMGAIETSVESGELMKLQNEKRVMEEKMNEMEQKCKSYQKKLADMKNDRRSLSSTSSDIRSTSARASKVDSMNSKKKNTDDTLKIPDQVSSQHTPDPQLRNLRQLPTSSSTRGSRSSSLTSSKLAAVSSRKHRSSSIASQSSESAASTTSSCRAPESNNTTRRVEYRSVHEPEAHGRKSLPPNFSRTSRIEKTNDSQELSARFSRLAAKRPTNAGGSSSATSPTSSVSAASASSSVTSKGRFPTSSIGRTRALTSSVGPPRTPSLGSTRASSILRSTRTSTSSLSSTTRSRTSSRASSSAQPPSWK